MDSRLEARLRRLRLLNEADLAALPYGHDLAPTMTADEHAEGGGVSLADTEEASSAANVLEQNSSDSAATVLPHINNQAAPTQSSSNEAEANEHPENRFVWVQGSESSHNLGSKPKPLDPSTATSKLAPIDLKRSELASQGEKYFAPIVALSKYPYRFCDKASSQTIASAFFDQGKFWAREWDLYYLWDIEESKPIILVREGQVEDLLSEINLKFDLAFKITDLQREEGLLVHILDHPRCRPRYLGRSRSRTEYDSMISDVPGVAVRPVNESDPPPLNEQLVEDFKLMVQDAWQATRNKSKAMKEKKRVGRLQKLQVITDQFKRAQRYLGLRPTAIQGQAGTGAPPAVDVSLPAPFVFDRSVVLVCVDVEAYEKDHSKITEIGIATLDTRDLEMVAPGRNAENWRSFIKARHFRIRDYAHLVNSEYVSGCPGSFFFGESEFVSLKDATALVASCFEPPFCFQPGSSLNVGETGSMEKRNLIFLGHDTFMDIKYLQNLGFDPLLVPNLLEAQDSATLYRVWRRDDQISKLGRILERFKIDAFGLHNAGNDSVYTMQSLLAVLVSEASIRNTPEVQQARNDQKESKIVFEQQEVKKDIENEYNGWDALEADGDGGSPVPIVVKKPGAPVTILQTGKNGTPHSPSVGVHGRGEERGYNGRGSRASSRDRSRLGRDSSRVRTPPTDAEFNGGRGTSHSRGRDCDTMACDNGDRLEVNAPAVAPKPKVFYDDGWGGKTAEW